MITRKTDTRPTLYFLSTPSPETSPRSSLSSPVVVSDWDADDEETMSMEDITPTRDTSVGVEDETPPPLELYTPQRPTLPDVLSNSAPPPWTLSAFTAYLSQNHCLENLEFTMDAERYRERHDALAVQMSGMPVGADVEECRYVRMLWQRLLDAYVIPDGPREINIPSAVRDRLLSLPNHTVPPSPEQLDDAVKIVYKLMEESVLISFLNEAPQTRISRPMVQVKPSPVDRVQRKRGGSDSSTDKKSSRSKSRRRASPTASDDAPFSPSDPTGMLTPAVNNPKGHRTPSHTSSASNDPGLMTDDSNASNGTSSPREIPLTPPHSPHSSDIGGHSPKQRSDLTWKKMLGWKKKSSSGMRDSRFPTLED